MMASPKKSKGSAPRPSAKIADPLTSLTDNIYKNVENGPLVSRIKTLEVRLDELLGVESIEVDQLDPEGKRKGVPKATTEEGKKEAMEGLLNELLDCFMQLLKSPYGALAYLVESDSESIIKLYDVDSYDDYYVKLQGSTINVGSRELEGMVAGAGGERLFGVETNDIAIKDPSETPGNMEVANRIVGEIVESIKEKLEEADETD